MDRLEALFACCGNEACVCNTFGDSVREEFTETILAPDYTDEYIVKTEFYDEVRTRGGEEFTGDTVAARWDNIGLRYVEVLKREEDGAVETLIVIPGESVDYLRATRDSRAFVQVRFLEGVNGGAGTDRTYTYVDGVGDLQEGDTVLVDTAIGNNQLAVVVALGKGTWHAGSHKKVKARLTDYSEV